MSRRPASFQDVTAFVDSNQLELDVLQYWESEKIFERTLQQMHGKPLFSFYDGPPYAQGKPHYGHVLQSAIKDTILRYKTMRGYYAPRRVGWDTHGLPVEVFVEKELGLKTKKDIEAYGIDRFNEQCRATVFRYIDLWVETLKRLGRWADYAGGYATLNLSYMESEWWVFKQLWDKQLVYKDFRSTPYCIRCETPLSNFEVSSSYKDKVDQAVFVLMEVSGEENLYLAVWTTTPWTLPANVAVAANSKLKYVVVEHDNKNIIIAQDRVQSVFGNKDLGAQPINFKRLQNLRYEPLYTFTGVADAFRVVAGPHVTGVEGTGLVHMAPAFGEEDMIVAEKTGLPIIRNVDTTGAFTAEVTPWAGQSVFDANKSIIEDLKDRGLLLKQESFTHSYPHCWRCDQPLIYYALDTWFVKVSAIKSRMLAVNEKISWIPEHLKRGRFRKGIESAPDWAVSRNRFWSTPLPVWECNNCHTRECLGSLADLKEKTGDDDITDIHRPMVDAYTWPCSQCAGTMQRVEEVLDVWFDAGSMPYAQWHYPFENRALVSKTHPADFIVEAIEQTRSWFYVLHVLSVALTESDQGLGKDQPAFTHAVGSGLIFAEDGRKLSKKLKNYPEIEPTLQQYGADVLRLYLLASSSLGEPYRFSEKDLRNLKRNVYVTLWNVYSFFVRYANTHHWRPGKAITSTHWLDRWIMARTTALESEMVRLGDAYHIDHAARLLVSYIDDLSNWYVRRSRVRFQKPPRDVAGKEAFATLYAVLCRLDVVLAPFMPFVTENMWRNLTGKPSVHLENFPAAQELPSDGRKLLAAMEQAREVVSLGLALRAQAGIKIRQPLAQVIVAGLTLPPELNEIVKDELNVKAVLHEDPHGQLEYVWSPPGTTIKAGLATTITRALQQEGIAREIIRHGQVLRKEAGYALNDRLELQLATSSTALTQAVKAFRPLIEEALQVDKLQLTIKDPDAQTDITVTQENLTIGVKKTSQK